MASGRALCVAAVLAICAAAAPADIINGDFANGLTGYVAQVIPPGDPSVALAEVVNGELHIRTVNTWTWNDSLQIWEGTGGNLAILSQAVAEELGFYAPAGTDAIEFDARVTVANNPPANLFAGVKFDINYDTAIGGETNTTGIMVDVDETVHVDMTGLVPDAPAGIDFNLKAFGAMNPSTPQQAVTSYDITVDAYFDNFRFVPEPGSMVLLAVGAAGLLAHRRRP